MGRPKPIVPPGGTYPNGKEDIDSNVQVPIEKPEESIDKPIEKPEKSEDSEKPNVITSKPITSNLN